jgi:hypothetical protein
MINASRGFAALPLILIIAVVVTSGAIAATLLTGEDQLLVRQQQQEAVDRAEQAITGFLLAYQRLPCPDLTNNGQEDCPANLNAPQQVVGMVPYRTLGLTGKQTLTLLYAPYIGSDSAFNLTDNGEPQADVIRIELPEEMPLLNFVMPTVPIPEPPEDPDPFSPEYLELLLAVQSYENFRASLLVNNAVNRFGFPVANRLALLSAFPFPPLSYPSGNYLNAFAADLSPDLPQNAPEVPSLAFESGNPIHTELVEYLADLWRFYAVVQARSATYRDVVDMAMLQTELSQIVANVSLNDAQKVIALNVLKSEWQALVNQHNNAVNAFNARTSGNALIDAIFLAADADLELLVYIDPDLNSTNYAVLRGALTDALIETSNQVQENSEVLGTAIGDVIPDVKNKTEDLPGVYESHYLEAETRRQYYQFLLLSPTCLFNPGLCTNYSQYVAEYNALSDRYYRLYRISALLHDDLFCRALDDGNCVPDAAEQGYLDWIESLSPAPPDTNPTYPDNVFNTGPDPEADRPGFLPRQTQPVVYPIYRNLADICHKLESIMAAGTGAALRYDQGGNSGAAAFLLVEYGNNLRLDEPNIFPANVGLFAAPDRPHTLDYDDRVRPVTAEKLYITLSCAALLQSYRSFANTAVEIDLLYRVAADSLDGANQDVITSSIDVALATIRLAVDTAAIIKDSAGGAAATAACIASLGLAVNACISAGFQFSAAVAHGLTLIGDGIALGLAIESLVTAVGDRDAAYQTLGVTVAQYGLVIEEALAVDFRGGVLEAPQ